MQAGLHDATAVHVRKALEFGVTAQWIATTSNGVDAFFAKSVQSDRAVYGEAESRWVLWRLPTLETRMELCRRNRPLGSRGRVVTRRMRRRARCGWFARCEPSSGRFELIGRADAAMYEQKNLRAVRP